MDRREFLKLLTSFSIVALAGPRGRLLKQPIASPQNQSAPNIIILVFDALSAKHMSVYGYHRETTPNLARFAERATVYHAHYAAGNFTTSGTSSLLTGTYPWSHRAFNFDGEVSESSKHRNLFREFAGGDYNRVAYTHNWLANVLLYQFREDLDTLINLKEFYLINGRFSDRVFPNDTDSVYRAERFLFRGSIPGSLFLSLVEKMSMLAREKNIVNIVGEYARLYPRGVPRHFKSFFLLEHAIDGIKTFISNSPRPFLGYFHLLPPHEPYHPRREFIGLYDDGWTPEAKKAHFFSQGWSDNSLNQWWREYDEHIAYTDAEFGRLYDFLEQTGALENTYVIVTTDHGQLFERGIHGHLTPVLYEPVIRIPLLISKPNIQSREDVYTPTSCVDLLPTLLHATGRAVPDWCEGKVLPTFDAEAARSERSIFSVEAKLNPKYQPLTKGTVALVRDRYKLIHYFGYDGYENEYELYDHVNDPQEVDDLYSSMKSVAADLQSELKAKLHEVNQPYLNS